MSFGYRPWFTTEILFFIRLVAQGTNDELRSEERDTQHRETPTTTTTIATTKVTAGGKTWLSDTAYMTAGDTLADPIFVFYYDYYLRSVDRKEGNGRGDEEEERRGVYR